MVPRRLQPEGDPGNYIMIMKSIFVVALATSAALLSVRASAQAQVSSSAFAACLDHDDGTKERLTCFDKLVRPEIQQVLAPQAPRTIYDCRYIKEEDQRLTCFNRFVASPARPAAAKRAPKVQ